MCNLRRMIWSMRLCTLYHSYTQCTRTRLTSRFTNYSIHFNVQTKLVAHLLDLHMHSPAHEICTFLHWYNVYVYPHVQGSHAINSHTMYYSHWDFLKPLELPSYTVTENMCDRLGVSHSFSLIHRQPLSGTSWGGTCEHVRAPSGQG